ncbi:hypothetical protein LCGC14_2242790, partial [marine sediment metagenome]
MRFTSHLGQRFAMGLLPLALLQGCGQELSANTEASATAAQSALASVQQVDNGVIVSFAKQAASEAKSVRLQVVKDDIIRVTSIAHDDFSVLPKSIMLTDDALSSPAKFTTTRQGNKLLLKTAKVSAEISLIDGKVSFKNSQGETVLAEADRRFTAVTGDPITPDHDSFAIRQQWNKGSDEGFFGLGQQQNNQVNYAGENVELTTHNLEIAIPFVVSTRNYGVLWDNNSVTNFGDPEQSRSLNQDFVLYDAQGNKGGLTAQYY